MTRRGFAILQRMPRNRAAFGTKIVSNEKRRLAILLPRLFLLGAVLILCGCGESRQKNSPMVLGTESFGLSGILGDVTILFGDIPPFTAADTHKTPLLYYLMAAPGLTCIGSGHEGSIHECTTVTRWTWQTAHDKFSAEAKWNACSNRVEIGANSFDTKNGNAFVIIRDANGKLAAQQFGPFDPKLAREEVFKRMKESLPSDSPAKSAEVIQWNNDVK